MTAVPEGFPKLDKQTRPWKCRRDDPTCTRQKPCKADQGARNRRSGMRKQRAGRKVIEAVSGAVAARFAGQLGNEEAWTGLPVRVEVKSGAQTRPCWTAFLKAEAQAQANHAIGDPRPFLLVAMGERTTDGLFVGRLSELARIIEGLVNEDG